MYNKEKKKNIENQFILNKILLLEDIKLKGWVVQLIHKQNSIKKRFCECLNKTYIIEE